ncbi:MAG TPA: hypothetical protein VMV48_03935 [Gallionellaceae bacterium]|nr:hypothetical protein [Gallionellaceae bacterium]
MNVIFSSLTLVPIVLLMTACANDSHVSTTRPDWIDNPGKGVSASAGMHARGRVAQEELAILRGREEYAKRFGVNIQSAQIASTSVMNDRSATVASKVTYEDTRQTDIKAMVKQKWRDTDSDVFWVWLVQSDQ